MMVKAYIFNKSNNLSRVCDFKRSQKMQTSPTTNRTFHLPVNSWHDVSWQCTIYLV